MAALRAFYASHEIVMLRRAGGVGFRSCVRRSRRNGHEQLRFHRPGDLSRLTTQINLLHAADLDGDGLNDLIVANNLRSKINLLYNQTGKTNRAAASPPRKLEINELPPDARFRIDSIPADERIAALVVTDLNGDGRPDIVFYGDAKDLEVHLQPGHERLERPETLAHRGRPDGRQRAGRRRFERRRPAPTSFCSATTARFIFCRNRRTTRLASRRKFPIPARPRPCKSWTWTATAGRICCWWIGTARRRSGSGCKMPPASLARKFISRRQPIRSYCADNLEGDSTNYSS